VVVAEIVAITNRAAVSYIISDYINFLGADLIPNLCNRTGVVAAAPKMHNDSTGSSLNPNH
jgi:hypothetical protein